MSNSWFRFKRFTVWQDGCAMKVGTDGVLLGAWCRVEASDRAVLDIGAGTGLVAMQLAQRTEASGAVIEAVEIDLAACETARCNFETSEWGHRLMLHEGPVQEFAARTAAVHGAERAGVTPHADPPGEAFFDHPVETLSDHSGEVLANPYGAARRFDHIVSNPPYFVGSLASPSPSRCTARHADALTYGELISVCDKLLQPYGRVSLVLPAGAETREMIAVAGARGFVISRFVEVHSTPRSGPKRTLMEFLRAGGGDPISTDNLISSTERLTIGGEAAGTFSDDYRALTRDFYLYF